MRIINRGGHQHAGFVAGIAEHQALIAGALVEVIVLRLIYALRNIRALLVVADHDGAAFIVNAVIGVVVADVLDGIARNANVIDVGGGGNFARQNNQAGIAKRLSRNP